MHWRMVGVRQRINMSEYHAVTTCDSNQTQRKMRLLNPQAIIYLIDNKEQSIIYTSILLYQSWQRK
jgi:hypothetical protein